MLHGGRARGSLELLSLSSWPWARAGNWEIPALVPWMLPMWPPRVSLWFPLRQDMVWPSKSHRGVLGIVAENWLWSGDFQLLFSSVLWGWWQGCTRAAEGEQTLWTTHYTLNLQFGRWHFCHSMKQQVARRDLALCSLAETSLLSITTPRSLRPLFQQGINFMVNTSSCWLLHWDYARVCFLLNRRLNALHGKH